MTIAINKNQMTLLPFIQEDKLREIETDPNVAMIKSFPAKYDPYKSQESVKELTKRLYHVNYDFDHWLDVCLAALESREEEYMKLIEGIERSKLDNYVKAFAVIQDFFLEGYYDDILGTYYQSNHPRSGNGYFITPFNISRFMAEMLDIKPTDTACDPACGSGSMLLAMKYVIHKKYGWIQSCYFLPKLYGIDIGYTQVRMCKIQLYLSNYLFMISRVYDVVLGGNKK